MTQHITLGGLPLVNLKRKPFRTAALTIVVAMLTVAFYGGSLLSMNLEAGLNSMQERMGADLMVTPQNTKNEAEALLTNGSASTFYFTNEITDEVAKADGIDEITEQTYISSLARRMLRRESPDHRIQPRYRLRDHPLDRIAVRRHAPARPDRCRSQHQRVGQQHGQTLWARIPRGGATRQYRARRSTIPCS